MGDGVNVRRRQLLTAATSVVGAVGAVGVAVPFIGSWNPSAKAKAAGAPVKVNLGKIEPGQMMVVEWRGKPVYIVRRTEEVLGNLKKIAGRLADPMSEREQQPDYVLSGDPEYRSLKPEYLIVTGVCTHLGCAPKYRTQADSEGLGGDWVGGFLCPCHGSKFDLAGRVYKGVPAPSNLEVPPHSFVDETVVVIGVETA